MLAGTAKASRRRAKLQTSPTSIPPSASWKPWSHEVDAPPTPELGRRSEHRVEVELDVSLGSDEHLYVGLTENLSLSGVFVATHILLRIGERLGLKVHLPERAKSVHGVGVVRWVRACSPDTATAPGMGIEFEELDEGCLDALESFLETLSE